MSSPINVGFWTTFYETSEDDDQTYHDVLAATDNLVTRAERLWDWKDLSRGVAFDKVRPVLADLDSRSYTERDPSTAVEALGQHLVDADALSNATVVTPAFILHLADSGPGDYSTQFPLFDARVWTAFVFLTLQRTGCEKLPVGATSSPAKYGDFVDFFERTIPEDTGGREYERALFRFGSYLAGTPAERVEEIDAHLERLEIEIGAYAGSTDRYLVTR